MVLSFLQVVLWFTKDPFNYTLFPCLFQFFVSKIAVRANSSTRKLSNVIPESSIWFTFDALGSADKFVFAVSASTPPWLALSFLHHVGMPVRWRLFSFEVSIVGPLMLELGCEWTGMGLDHSRCPEYLFSFCQMVKMDRICGSR